MSNWQVFWIVVALLLSGPSLSGVEAALVGIGEALKRIAAAMEKANANR